MVYRDSDSYLTLSQYLVTKIKGSQVTLGIQDVYLGDQTSIPRTPAVCVDPGGKSRQLTAAPRRTTTTMRVYVIVYHGKIASTETIVALDDKLAEDIETLIHADQFMGNSVIDSIVTDVESGFVTRRNTFFRATRLTIEARSVQNLPSST